MKIEKPSKKRNCFTCAFAEDIDDFQIVKTCTCIKSCNFGTDVTVHKLCEWYDGE